MKRPVFALFILAVDAAHAQVFDLEVIVHAVLRSLAPLPGFLDAAERRHLVRDDALVDADDSVFECLRDTPDASDIAGIKITGESDFRVVRHLNGFFLSFEAEQWRHRTKNFLAKNAHVIMHPRQNRGLDETTAKL